MVEGGKGWWKVPLSSLAPIWEKEESGGFHAKEDGNGASNGVAGWGLCQRGSRKEGGRFFFLHPCQDCLICFEKRRKEKKVRSPVPGEEEKREGTGTSKTKKEISSLSEGGGGYLSLPPL